MKRQCQEWLCDKEATYQDKRNSQWYCCVTCALVDSRASSRSMKSEKTDSSSSIQHGALSQELLTDVQEIEKETNEIESSELNQSEDSTMKRKNFFKLGREQVTTEEKEETLIDFEEPIQKGEIEQILPKESESSMQNLDVALSASTNICDQSIKSMHELLKEVESSVKLRRSEPYHGVDPKLVNAACNVAAQMANLMKMKLASHKMAIDHRKK